MKFKVNISTASSSIASVFHKHININTGNALLVTMHKSNRAWFQVLFIHIFHNLVKDKANTAVFL